MPDGVQERCTRGGIVGVYRVVYPGSMVGRAYREVYTPTTLGTPPYVQPWVYTPMVHLLGTPWIYTTYGTPLGTPLGTHHLWYTLRYTPGYTSLRHP